MAISERPGLIDDHISSRLIGHRMTLEEFLALPDVKPSLEFDAGLVRQKVAAKPVHGSLQSYLATAFNQVAWPSQLGMAFTEARFVTPDWAPVPDVVFYLSGRGSPDDAPLRTDGTDEASLPSDFTEPPDIAIEIKSPGQSVSDQIQKCLRYCDIGVSIVLFVHSEERSVLVFRPGQSPRMHQGDDSIDLVDLLPGFDLTVRGMFEAVAPAWFRRRRHNHPGASDTGADGPTPDCPKS